MIANRPRGNQNVVVKQHTVTLPSRYGTILNFLHKMLGSLPRPVQYLLIALLNRMRDHEPEAYDAIGIRATVWGWLPKLASTSMVGMVLVAYAFANARDGGSGLRTFFYPGLLLIYTPTAVRLISPVASRVERISLLCIVGICCYLIKIMSSPLYFSFYNEFLHWRTADDIARSGHLFSQNTLLPVSPYYPGLEIVTNTLSTLSGLNTFKSGIIVIGIARLLMILTLFALNEQILKSTRMASIATMLYMANPHFILYDTQFGYESLALTLAIFILSAIGFCQLISLHLSNFQVLLTKTESKRLNTTLRWIMVTAWIALVALTLTHHVTDFFLDGVLILWTVIYGSQRVARIYQSSIAKTALLGVLLSAAWINCYGNPIVRYLSSPFINSLNDLRHILAGRNDARPLFVTYGGGQSAFLWERLLMALAVMLILFCLPFGLLCLWQRYRSNALILTFGIISIFYPISQIFRFTNFGANITDRAAAFLFIPIASVLAIFITQFWPAQRLNRKQSSLIAGAMSVMFLGGFILGAGAGLAELPGPYEFSDPRAIGPEGIQAATWASSHLGPNNRIGCDFINQILMETYGNQRIVTSSADHIDVSPVFFSSYLSPYQISTLQKAQIRYLVVDLRLARALSLVGVYFEEEEPNAFHHTTPIDLKALTKFDTRSPINRMFDSGNIVIYDVGGLTNAHKKP